MKNFRENNSMFIEKVICMLKENPDIQYDELMYNIGELISENEYHSQLDSQYIGLTLMILSNLHDDFDKTITNLEIIRGTAYEEANLQKGDD